MGLVGRRGGSIQPRVATVTLRNGSKPMALIGLPNVPPLFLESLLSNPAHPRTTTRVHTDACTQG